ncbi:hypothetical protein [Kitasatospora sp. MAA4]|nr:hypothetical protein [Kitasatospora sp. MAA4]
MEILDQGGCDFAMGEQRPAGTRIALRARWFVVAAEGGGRPGS